MTLPTASVVLLKDARGCKPADTSDGWLLLKRSDRKRLEIRRADGCTVTLILALNIIRNFICYYC